MKYRTLGSTNLPVSIIGLGTWQYGGEWGIDYTGDRVRAIIDKAAELGVNLIDTAECYGAHRAEEFVGSAIKGKRQKWIIATKFGHEFHGYMDRSRLFGPREIITQLEGSLKALQTDYIDIYQIHSPTDEEFDNENLWKALWKEQHKGKIRHLGISISKNRETRQTNSAPRVHAQVIQAVYNRLDRGPEEDVFPLCQKHNLGVLARVPLASGYLSGKYKPGNTFEKGDVRSTHDPENVRKKLEEVERIAAHEVPQGIPMAQWAIAWCLKNPAVAAAIPGSKNPEQLEMNVKAVDLLDDNHPLARKKP
jgi:Predicted oxidoreductases (related to aryl-alcohol dehydrogenases)